MRLQGGADSVVVAAVLRCVIASLVAGGAAAAGAEEPPPPKPLQSPTPEDFARGRALFRAQCTGCHGMDGTGGSGPRLARRRLRRAPDDEALVRVLREGIPGTGMAAAWQNGDRDLVRLAAFVRSLGRVELEALPGDPGRGRALFEGRGACTACHIVRGVGAGLGPDLSEIGAERGGAHLRQALLEPGASRPEEMIPFEPRSLSAYLVVTAGTRDGRTIAGYRVNEDAFTIQLREADGGLVSLRKGELASLRKDADRSPMPGYGAVLAPAEMEDLVAYLASLGGE
jgi:putative heme-binding domain-containing protein